MVLTIAPSPLLCKTVTFPAVHSFIQRILRSHLPTPGRLLREVGVLVALMFESFIAIMTGAVNCYEYHDDGIALPYIQYI